MMRDCGAILESLACTKTRLAGWALERDLGVSIIEAQVRAGLVASQVTYL
jgi:hypothetical protein